MVLKWSGLEKGKKWLGPHDEGFRLMVSTAGGFLVFHGCSSDDSRSSGWSNGGIDGAKAVDQQGLVGFLGAWLTWRSMKEHAKD